MRRAEQQRALEKMQQEIDIQQTQLNDARANFEAKLGLDAIERDYVFLVGELSQSRVALPFEIKTKDSRRLYQDIFNALLANDYVDVGDRVIFTQGDLDGVSGSTNSMRIIEVVSEK